jgi:maleylpyruvate isomerase
MDADRSELNGQIDLATQRLLDHARTLNETDLRAASLLPGWTRAYVLAHLARGADAMRALLASVTSGEHRAVFAGAQEVAAATEESAARPAADLMTDLADSAMALRAVARRLPDDAWQVVVELPGLGQFLASEVLTRRLTEVELHHCDLGTGYGPGQWLPAFAAMDLPEPLRAQRDDRLGFKQPAAAAERAPAAGTPAPWKAGQPLPGSWIGTRRGPVLP